MNLEEWLTVFYKYTQCGVPIDIGTTTPHYVTFEEIRKGICDAVLKEKTITTAVVKSTEHYDEIARPEDPERIVTMSQNVGLRAFVPDGEYFLVAQDPFTDIDLVAASLNELVPGDYVKYLGASDEQVNWAACADPRGVLTIGKVYQLEKVDVHTWHTKIFLTGIDSQQGFNSASFQKVVASES